MLGGGVTSRMIGGVITVKVAIFDWTVVVLNNTLAVAWLTMLPLVISCSVTSSVPLQVVNEPGAIFVAPEQSTEIRLSATLKGALSVTLPLFVILYV